MTLFDATEQNVSVSHFRYIWTLFLMLNMFCHEWSRIVRLCNDLLYKVDINLNTVYMTRFEAI
jgi:hypothetical protein